MDEKARIEMIMEKVQLNSGQFAIQIGIQNSTLSHILNNRNKPSLEVLKKILQRFPFISSDWLILGQGAMFRPEFKSQERSLFDFSEEIPSLSDNLIKNSSEKSIPESEPEKVDMLKSEEPPHYGIEKKVIREQTEGNPESADRNENLLRPAAKIHVPGFITHDESAVNVNSRKVSKIILYYSDNTFQEFESK